MVGRIGVSHGVVRIFPVGEYPTYIRHLPLLATLEVRAGYLCVFDPLVGELAAAVAVALCLHQQVAILVEALEEAGAVVVETIRLDMLVVRQLLFRRLAGFLIDVPPHAVKSSTAHKLFLFGGTPGVDIGVVFFEQVDDAAIFVLQVSLLVRREISEKQHASDFLIAETAIDISLSLNDGLPFGSEGRLGIKQA